MLQNSHQTISLIHAHTIHTDNSFQATQQSQSNNSYSHIISGEGAPNTHWRKDSVFNKWCQEIGYPHVGE